MSKQTNEIMGLLLEYHLPSVERYSKIGPNVPKPNIGIWGKKNQIIKLKLHTQFCPILTYIKWSLTVWNPTSETDQFIFLKSVTCTLYIHLSNTETCFFPRTGENILSNSIEMLCVMLSEMVECVVLNSCKRFSLCVSIFLQPAKFTKMFSLSSFSTVAPNYAKSWSEVHEFLLATGSLRNLANSLANRGLKALWMERHFETGFCRGVPHI